MLLTKNETLLIIIAGLITLYVMYTIYRVLRIRHFRKDCLTKIIDLQDPIAGQVAIGENKHPFVLLGRIGYRMNIKYHDGQKEIISSAHLDQLYPTW